MIPEHVRSALSLLRIVRQETDAIGVAVSFGKDSLATLDLCSQVFDRIEGYYLFRVRGLSIVDEWADAVKRRYGVTVRMYPHFDLSRCYRSALLQPHWKGTDKAPVVKMADIDAHFRNEAQVNWIAYGWRRNDSFSRALIMKQCAGYDPKAKRLFPLRSWKRSQVYDYLDQRKIPLPPGLGRKEQGGLDFHPGALATLKKERPDDWAKWLRDFPFADMQLLDQPVESTETAHPGSNVAPAVADSP